jgi:ubiquinol-cytochrome c reductase cytochrome c subunit
MPLVDSGRKPASRYDQSPPGQLLGDPNATPSRHTPIYDPATVAALVGYVASIAPGGLPVPQVQTNGADLSIGAQLYRLQCAACHSWDGTGGALYQREAPSLHSSSPLEVAEAIRTGPGQMPAFGVSAIPDAQLDDVVAYVRYLDHPDDPGGWDLWHLGPVAEGGLALLVGLAAFLLAARWIGERT